MPYLAICEDVDGGAELRRRVLQDHLDYVEQHAAQIAVAGPIGEKPYTASLFLYQVEELATAESLLHHDPYYRAGLYEDVWLELFTPAIGTWVGGRQW